MLNKILKFLQVILYILLSAMISGIIVLMQTVLYWVFFVDYSHNLVVFSLPVRLTIFIGMQIIFVLLSIISYQDFKRKSC